jgi:N-acetylneuraminic acid mutarotase
MLSDGLHVLGGAPSFNAAAGNVYRDHYIYNPTTKAWSTAAPIPDGDTWSVQANAYKNKLYLTGGWPSGDFRFRVYDPNSNSWASLPNIPHPYSYGYVSCVVGDVLYLIGGRDGAATNAAVCIFDLGAAPQGSWSLGPPIPQNRNLILAGAAWGTKIYVLNGDSAGGPTILQIFDTVARSWSGGAGLGAHYEAASSRSLDGKVYFFGGHTGAYYGGPGLQNAVNIYDVATNTWSQGPNMPTARFHSTVQLVASCFHVFGGFTPDTGTAAHEAYCP